MKQKNIKIKCIVSGGQTGVDRAALDFSMSKNIKYAGYCPKGGWAEDMPQPPGLLNKYKNLLETDSNDPNDRTERNVINSDCTMIILPSKEDFFTSNGSIFTKEMAEYHSKPYLVVYTLDYFACNKICNWLLSFDNDFSLNIAGPRESECIGIYDKAIALLNNVYNNCGILFINQNI